MLKYVLSISCLKCVLVFCQLPFPRGMNILKTMALRYTRDFPVRPQTHPKWPVIIAFSNSPGIVWTENIWCLFRVKPLFWNFTAIVWTRPKSVSSWKACQVTNLQKAYYVVWGKHQQIYRNARKILRCRWGCMLWFCIIQKGESILAVALLTRSVCAAGLSIIVYPVASYRPHLGHFWANEIFLIA